MGARRVATFADRNAMHEAAKAKVRAEFEGLGFEVFEDGIELNPELAEAMREQDDRCSLMLRYRPDYANVFRGGVSVLCEVKHGWKMEARAYRAVKEWNAGGNVAMVVVAGNGDEVPRASFVTDVPEPVQVIVPRRHDFEAQWEAMQRKFPGAELVAIEKPRRGSGTPFVNLARRHFLPLRQFIFEKLLDMPDPNRPWGQGNLGL